MTDHEQLLAQIEEDMKGLRRLLASGYPERHIPEPVSEISQREPEPLTQQEVLGRHKHALRALMADLLQPDTSPEHYYNADPARGFGAYVCVLRNCEGVPFVGHAYNLEGEEASSLEVGRKMAFADALGSLFHSVGQDIGLLGIGENRDGQSEG
jgi:hypothetical protein